MATVDVAVENEENDYSKDGLDLVNTDPMLEQHKGHLQYRWEKFREVKKAIENASVEELSKIKGISDSVARTIYDHLHTVND